jgi:molybdopterin-guanine dinucleotide biosynthesis protein A
MIRQKAKNISGIVLAGGYNSRFGGKNKADIVIGGKRIITRIMDILEQIFEEIIIITNAHGEFDHIPGCIIGCDRFLNVGPLGGIHAAMKTSTKEAVFIVACDMPNLNKELIIRQIEFYNANFAEAIIPEVNCNLEPLHGIYRNILYDRLEKNLSSQNGYSVKDFIKSVNVSLLKLDATEEIIKSFTNINTPHEAQKAITDFLITL